MKSISTHQIAGRGTVKVVERGEIKSTLRVGDVVEIDDARWTIAGIESFSPRKPTDKVGLIVRPYSDGTVPHSHGNSN